MKTPREESPVSASNASPPPPGVFCPVPTFLKNGVTGRSAASSKLQATLDTEAQVTHSVHLAKNGVRGLVLMGSTGEAIHLSPGERYTLIFEVRKGLIAAGFVDYPIIAGVLTNAVDETLEWLDDAKAAGAQWGLILTPGYFGPAVNQTNLQEWYTLVADNSPLPILIYNYPGVTNNMSVSLESYTKLAAHPKIVGCKMSHGNVSHHIQVSLDPSIDHDHFSVYSGFGQQLGPIVFFGAAGVIDGLAAIFPKAVSKLFELVWSAKDGKNPKALEDIRSMQFAISRAEEFVGKWGVVGIKEAVFRELSIGNLAGGRLPLKGQIPEGEWENWRVAMDAMRKLEED